MGKTKFDPPIEKTYLRLCISPLAISMPYTTVLNVVTYIQNVTESSLEYSAKSNRLKGKRIVALSSRFAIVVYKAAG